MSALLNAPIAAAPRVLWLPLSLSAIDHFSRSKSISRHAANKRLPGRRFLTLGLEHTVFLGARNGQVFCPLLPFVHLPQPAAAVAAVVSILSRLHALGFVSENNARRWSVVGGIRCCTAVTALRCAQLGGSVEAVSPLCPGRLL